jgi:hypothetical protein
VSGRRRADQLSLSRAIARRKAAGFFALVAVALGLSACGDGAASPGVANPSSPSTTTSARGSAGSGSTTASPGSTASSSHVANATAQGLVFAQCMRSHAIPSSPDPVTSGNKTRIYPGPSSGIDMSSPIVTSALHACGKYIPGSTLTRPQSAEDEAKLLKYAECMRSHGVANFSDPTPRPGNGWGFAGADRDQNSSSYQTADRACQGLEP